MPTPQHKESQEHIKSGKSKKTNRFDEKIMEKVWKVRENKGFGATNDGNSLESEGKQKTFQTFRSPGTFQEMSPPAQRVPIPTKLGKSRKTNGFEHKMKKKKVRKVKESRWF